MRYLLIIAILSSSVWAKEQAPVYWRFVGHHSVELRQAIVLERSDEDGHHLIVPGEVKAYLSGIQMPDDLGCIDDSGTCHSVDEGILNALGFGARIVARASTTPDGYSVSLNIKLLGGTKTESFKGSGKNLEEAARKAFAALRGQGTLVLKLSPSTASFKLDGHPFGQGSGDYIVPAGRHVLVFDALGHQSLQETIEIGIGKRVALSVKLPVADGKISLKIEPAGASVFLDDAPWTDSETLKVVKPGKHTIRAEKPGFFSVNRTIVIKPGTQHDLVLKLKDKEPLWKKALREKHDAVQKPWMVRLSVQFSSPRDGPIGFETNGSRDLEALSEAASLSGLGLSIGWRSQIWEATVFGLSYQSGSDASLGGLDQGTPTQINEMSRFLIRALWGGARYSIWKIDAFATTGLGYVLEDFSGTIGGMNAYSAAGARVIMGTELGLRYAVSSDWFVGMSGLFDYWPGERSTATLSIFGGYATDLDQWLR